MQRKAYKTVTKKGTERRFRCNLFPVRKWRQLTQHFMYLWSRNVFPCLMSVAQKKKKKKLRKYNITPSCSASVCNLQTFSNMTTVRFQIIQWETSFLAVNFTTSRISQNLSLPRCLPHTFQLQPYVLASCLPYRIFPGHHQRKNNLTFGNILLVFFFF